MYIIICLYGLIVGSFLNVCIYRIPREESIAFPSSHCPKCNTSLKWYDNIPVLSFIAYKGKCRYCGDQISPQYPIIEMLNALIYIIIFIKFGFTIDFIFYAIISSILIVVTVIDLQNMIIPDILIILILATTVIYKITSYLLYKTSPDILNSLGALALSSGIFLLIILISKGGMGGGDVTLIGSLGFILGVKNILLTIFLSFIFGAIISVLLLLFKIKGRKDPIPFGPFIVLGFFITLIAGDYLIDLYINLFII